MFYRYFLLFGVLFLWFESGLLELRSCSKKAETVASFVFGVALPFCVALAAGTAIFIKVSLK